MPELAEVEFFRKQWSDGVGEKILAVQLHAQKRIFRETDTRALARELKGRRLLRSSTRGKQMLFEFADNHLLGIHLGMSGKLRTERAGFRAEKHDHLVLQTKNVALVFRDPRLFGRVRFHHGKDLPAWCEAKTPEISSRKFHRKFLDDFLRRHARAPIKAVLLLQSGFPGIGNWMADEILWRAKIAPAKTAGSLADNDRAALLRETRFVARESLRIIGHDFSDPPKTWLIHERWKAAGKCPKHKTKLRREKIGGRTTAWCAHCQPTR